MGSFTVPSNAQPGPHVVIMTQSSPDGKLLQGPIRAVVVVTANGSSVPASLASPGAARADGLASSSNSVSTATLVLVGLGVAGVGIFLAGLGVFAAGRRGGRVPVENR
jgi:hypothetical protein